MNALLIITIDNWGQVTNQCYACLAMLRTQKMTETTTQLSLPKCSTAGLHMLDLDHPLNSANGPISFIYILQLKEQKIKLFICT